jgi:hypothetical protein
MFIKFKVNNFLGENSNDRMIIENIDSPLYKYGLIHRQDINNYFATKKKKILQKLKSIAVSLFLLFTITIYIVYAKKFRNKNFPFAYYDVLRLLGGLTEFYYGTAILVLILAFRLFYIFNFSDKKLYKWLEIIKVMKGLQPIETIGISDRNSYEKFIKKFKVMLFLVTTGIKFVSLSVISTFIFILIFFFKSMNEFYYMFFDAILGWLFIHCVYLLISYSFFYYFVVCYYVNLRFNTLNRMILEAIKKFHINKLQEILAEHNSICDDIFAFNKFWKKCFFAINYNIIPINLMLLHEILFEDSLFLGQIAAILITTGYLSSHFILNLITASVNKNTTKSRKNLLKLYYSMKFLLDPKIKIDVCIKSKLMREFKTFNFFPK